MGRTQIDAKLQHVVRDAKAIHHRESFGVASMNISSHRLSWILIQDGSDHREGGKVQKYSFFQNRRIEMVI